MDKIEWNDEFSVGVKALDIQHEKIIRMFNELVDNAYANAGSEIVSRLLTEMVDYASAHFKYEEQLLRGHAYPDLLQHKNGHMQFRRQAAELCLAASQQDEKIVHDLLNFLRDWWTDHILIEDRKYVALLSGFGDDSCHSKTTS
jgi:hemerythrin-like metal-binding protein